jgi:hypothetical protein
MHTQSRHRAIPNIGSAVVRGLKNLPDLALSLVAVALLSVVIPSASAYLMAGAQERECVSHLHRIWEAVQTYRREHGGDYPRALVAITPTQLRKEGDFVLVPRWLAPAELVCPADPNPNRRGWTLPCSYQYQLQESLFPETRQLVRTKLIDTFGARLRLVICTSNHHLGPSLLTLRADGVVARENSHALSQDP